MTSNPYAASLLVTSLIAAGLVVYGLRHRFPGRLPFVLLMFSTVIWSVGYVFELLSSDPTTMLFWVGVEYLGIATAPPLWLMFALRYAGMHTLLRPRNIAALMVIPCCTIVLAATSQFHTIHYAWYGMDLSGPFPLFALKPGPWYIVNVSYSYMCLIGGMAVFVNLLRHAPPRYHGQIALMIAAASAPMIVNVAYLAGVRPFGRVDLTPFALTVTGLLTLLGIARFGLLDLVPVARNALFEQLPDGVLVLDAARRVVDINAPAQQLLGLAQTSVGQQAALALAGWPALAALCCADDDAATQAILDDHAGGIYEIRRVSIAREGGPTPGHTILLRDVTARVRAERALANERRLFVAGPTVVFRWRNAPGWPVLYVSPNVAAQFGYTPDDLLSGAVLYEAIIAPEDRDRVRDEVAANIAAGQVYYEQEYRLVRPDGQVCWVYDFTVIERASDGAVQAFSGYVQDITTRKQAEARRLELERRMLHTQKLESLGVLAGGIAHDFNNLLMAVLGNLSLAHATLPPDAQAHPSLLAAEQAARRCAELTRQMLAYAGRGALGTQATDVSILVAEMSQMLRVSVSKHIEIEFDLDQAPPPVLADALQIQQVVLNLLVNAAEAIGDQPGTIRVTTRARAVSVAELASSRIAETPPPGEFLVLEVADNGCGMDAAVQERLFEPFFSTKFQGRGLGMAAVLGIVRGHQGTITVTSALGRGTTISVLLPVAADAGRVAGEGLPLVGSDARQGVVLVADDEESVREVTRAMLKQIGFEVMVAADGEDAVGVFREYATLVRAVVLDLTMPRLGGFEALQALRRIRADVPVLLTSGYSQEELDGRAGRSHLTGFLQKPYETRQLQVALDLVLAGTRDEG